MSQWITQSISTTRLTHLLNFISTRPIHHDLYDVINAIKEHNGGSDSHPFQPSYYFLYNNLNHSVKNPQYRPPFNRLQYSHYHKTKRTTVPAHSQSPAIQQVIKQHLTPQTVPRTNPSLIFVKINVHGIRLRAMLDTGATRSFITQRALAKIHHYSLQPRDRIAQLGDGHTMLKIVGEVHLWLKFDQIFTPLNVLVVKNLNTDFILGAGWCTQNAVQINYDTNQVSIRSSTGRIIIPYDKSIDYLTLDVKLINSVKIPPLPTNTRLGRVTHVTHQTDSFPLPDAVNSLSSFHHYVINSVEIQPVLFRSREIIDKLTNHIIDSDERRQIRAILQQHAKLFDISQVTQGNTPIQHTINTGDSLPISSRPYSRTIQQRSDLQNEIHKMLQAHQIRPSNSPWSSPVIIHKKKDGGGRKFYTKLDLKSGYFQIPIHEADKEKTAFITQDGLWEFNVLPQGIMNGPPTFQRTMHNLIGYGRWDCVIVYLDDILIFSTTFDEHVQHVREILSMLDKANFQVNPDKCNIAVREINFLSHTMNEKLIKPNGEKIKAITDLPAPTTLKEANEFLGKINWYRKFIPNFAHIAAPLHKYPDLSTPFVLTTDASEIGIGGILRQDTITGTKINYFKSRVLSDTERKYDTIEREALAIYWCLTELRSYIGDSDIIIETDHEPLQNFHKKQINNKRSNNTAADYISRHFPSSNVINNSTILAEQTYDWSVGIEQWFKDLPKPQRLRFATSFINTTNSTINPVTTRAKAKLIAQSVPPTSAEPSTTTPPFSAPSSTSDYLPFDFSLSHIRFEQEQDPVIQQIIQNFYHKSDNVSSADYNLITVIALKHQRRF
ncbi:unnamed protein product [Rotaria socialis]